MPMAAASTGAARPGDRPVTDIPAATAPILLIAYMYAMYEDFRNRG